MCGSYSYAWGKFTKFLNDYHIILRGPNNTSTNYAIAENKVIHIMTYFNKDMTNFLPKDADECMKAFEAVGEWFSDISLLDIFGKVQCFTEKRFSILWTNTNLIETADKILNTVHPTETLSELVKKATQKDNDFRSKYPYLSTKHKLESGK